MSKHKQIANAIFVGHIIFITIFFFGSLASYWYTALAPFQTALVIGTFAYHLMFGGCPLTAWEVKHRKLHNPDHGYGTSFYAHYLFGKLLGIHVSQQQVKVFLLITKILPGCIPVARTLQMLF